MTTNRGIPTWRERQKLLHTAQKKTDSSVLNEIGRRCLEAGRLQDAFEYFRAAGDQAALTNLSTLCIQEGDAFLFAAIEKALNRDPQVELWNKLGDRAVDLGKFRFARQAFERTQNEAKLAQVAAALGEPPPAPPASHDPEPS